MDHPERLVPMEEIVSLGPFVLQELISETNTLGFLDKEISSRMFTQPAFYNLPWVFSK